MRNLRTRPILIFLVALIALYCVIYLAPKVSGALRQSYTVEYGQLQIYDDAEAYLVRTETVYFAGTEGQANRYIDEGKLVRGGTKVMQVITEEEQKEAEEKAAEEAAQEASKGGEAEEAAVPDAGTASGGGVLDIEGHDLHQSVTSEPGDETAETTIQDPKFREIIKGDAEAGITTNEKYKTESEGVVTYNADGYEAELTPATMEEKGYGYYRGLRDDMNVDLIRDEIILGEPVFKVVDRSKWYLVCYIPSENGEKYEAGQKVTVIIDGKEQILGSVYSIEKEGKRSRLIISTNYYYEKMTTQRIADVKIITSDVRGLLIEYDSVTEEQNTYGVYVKKKTGDYEFIPVNIISTDGKKAIISRSYFYNTAGKQVSTVKLYDEILARP